MLNFLTGIGGKVLMALSLVGMLSAGLAVALKDHDKAVLAIAQVSQDKAIASAQAAAVAHEFQAIQDQQAQFLNQEAADAALKVKTHAAPTTNVCLSSPAVNALLSGLRGNVGANGARTKSSGSR